MKRVVVSVLVVLGSCSNPPSAGEPAKAAAKTEAKAEAKADAKAEAKADAKPEVKAEAKAEPTAEPAAAVGLAPEPFESDDGLSGYRSATGEVVIPAKYPMAMPFTDRVAGVVADDGWVFIDRTGNTLAKAFVFDNTADEFVEDRARIVDGELHGFIASSGEIIAPPTWSFAEPFSGGLAAVCEGCKREQMGEHYAMTGGKWGYIDASGKVVIPPRFSAVEPFVDGRASVHEGERALVIGPDGAELAP